MEERSEEQARRDWTRVWERSREDAAERVRSGLGLHGRPLTLAQILGRVR